MSTSVRTPRPQQHVLRLVMALTLSGFAAVTTAEPAKKAENEAVILACPTPLQVRIKGIPDVMGLRYSKAVMTCGKREPSEMEADDVGAAISSPEATRERTPMLGLTLRDGKLDVLLTLRNDTSARVYRAKLSTTGATDVSLHSDATGGPALSISIESLTGGPYVTLAVRDIAADVIAGKVARAASLQLHHAERLCHSPITLLFDIISARNVVQLMGDACGQDTQREGDNAYVYGKVAGAEKLGNLSTKVHEALVNSDDGARKAALLEIVRISSEGAAGELHAYVGDELAQLVELALADKDFVAAETWAKARVKEEERHAGPASRSVALAQLSQALTRAKQDDAAGAQALLVPALAQASHGASDFAATPSDGMTLAALARWASKAEKWEQAQSLLQLAHVLLDDTDGWDIGERSRVVREVCGVQVRLGFTLEEHHEDVAAVQQFESALALVESDGADRPTPMLLRELLIAQARKKGQSQRADELAARQAALARTEQGHEGLLHAWQLLTTEQAENGNFATAIATWQRVVDARKAGTSLHAAALRNLALLYRLGGDEAKAQEAEQRAGPPQANSMEEMGSDIAMEMGSYFDSQAKKLLAARQGDSAVNDNWMLMQERAIECRAVSLPGAAALDMESLWGQQRQVKGAADPTTQRLARRAIVLFEKGSMPDGARRVRSQMPGM